jgi:hypothetical protein
MLKALLEGQEGATDYAVPNSEVDIKIKKYQDFAATKLKPDLDRFEKDRDKIYKELGEYL